MSDLDKLRATAARVLKRCRIPTTGPLYHKALKAPEHFGLVAHQAAWLLHHVARAQRHLAILPASLRESLFPLLAQTLLAGERNAMLAEAQADKEPRLTEDDADLLVKASQRRDKGIDNLKAANARRAAQIDPDEYDRMVAAGDKQEQIAAHFGISRPTLRAWRRRNDRYRRLKKGKGRSGPPRS